jgi:hypothetical protein
MSACASGPACGAWGSGHALAMGQRPLRGEMVRRQCLIGRSGVEVHVQFNMRVRDRMQRAWVVQGSRWEGGRKQWKELCRAIIANALCTPHSTACIWPDGRLRSTPEWHYEGVAILGRQWGMGGDGILGWQGSMEKVFWSVAHRWTYT